MFLDEYAVEFFDDVHSEWEDPFLLFGLACGCYWYVIAIAKRGESFDWSPRERRRQLSPATTGGNPDHEG